MTGWGVFWNVYRRGMTTQTQVQSKRMKQAAAKSPQQTAATRSMATTSAAATTPNTTKGKEEDDEKAWVNEWDDVSLYAFLYLR
jgi:type II secretory pathway component HofQ